ncbi:MAG: bifunctional [glutamine synthetase] adenylyltransferase/[glutamine synthetase]-adenylyl-L-tyrosine phosphorylase [Pseudomonadota bacterium]
MSLTRLTRTAPLALDTVAGDECLSFYPGLAGPVAELVRGAGGSSTYLAGLLRREAEWLSSQLSTPLPDALTAARDATAGADLKSLGAALRTAKRRTALLLALGDLGGAMALSEVTGALTEFADWAVETAAGALLQEEAARGGLPGFDAVLDPRDAGYLVLAMGKMGAFELNYSSDIDLIVLFDETRFAPEDHGEARAGFVRVTRKLVRMLSDVTDGGYVFRTDLRLRPNPAVTPVCVGLLAAERYYEAHGRTWERAAFIKARVCAGDRAAGEAFLTRMRPFVFRRHLDFAAIEDAREMMRKIRHHKGLTGPITVHGHDVKLGRGGIREIEFFTQTQQLICGGRDPHLQAPGTQEALTALRDAGWVEPAEHDALQGAYMAHRTLEHRIQMLEDAQTHRVPRGDARFAALAALCGTNDLPGFEAGLARRFETVHAITGGDVVQEHAAEPATPVCFEDAASEAMVESWHRLPATRSDRASAMFGRMQPEVLRRLGQAADPGSALAQFDAFLRGLPAGVQVFSLFQERPALLDLLVQICSSAPALARYLGRNAGVLDAVLDPRFYAALPDLAGYQARLAEWLDRAGDFEDALDLVRLWNKEARFQVGVHLLRQISSPEEVAVAYADIAEATVNGLMAPVIAEVSRRHGPPPGRGAAVLGMGKLGTRAMTATSDLDLIVIYDADPADESAGPKPIPAAQYYAKLTKTLVNALTVPTAEGRLYEVDMRLRPSGKQGPVATGFASFRTYQAQEAWTWEHLALCRARAVAGRADLRRDVTEAIADVLLMPWDRERILADTAAMRARLAEARKEGQGDPWEVKQGPGRLLDIDLFLQAGVLICGLGDRPMDGDTPDRLRQADWLDTEEHRTVVDALGLHAHVQALARLCVEGRFDPSAAGAGLAEVLTGATGHESLEELATALETTAGAAAALIDRRIGTGLTPDDARTDRPA